ncbi:MAG: metallophosphoesterase [Flavobacteriales bacterium]|nr:metallophosphoesterase [Flavobacteriales bacterium]
MKTKLITLALFVFAAIGSTLAQPILIRGPYLNTGTTSSMVVRWRTDVSSDTKLWYGTSMDTASMVSIIDVSSAIDHEVNVTGLAASTKYFYAIGTTTDMLAGADSGHYFMTSPPAGTKQPIRILAMGDIGTGSTKQTAVKDAYLDYTNNAHTDVWIWLGDNAYNDGRDADFDANTFPMYPDIFPRTVLWPSLGNHDYGSLHPISPDGPGPYLNMFTLPTAGEAGGTASNDEGYYSYDYGNVHFISINSEDYSWSGFPPNITITHNPDMLTWLENDLTNNTNKDWIIAYFHATPYADGTHSEAYSGSDPIKIIDGTIMRTMRDYFVPILENHGVDLILAGHSHDYERSYFTYGNYGSGGPYPPDSTVLDAGTGRLSDGAPYQKFTTGPNANKGGVFCVIGSSAKTGDFVDDGPLNHELMIFDDYRLGSLLIEVDDDQLNAYFIDTSGTAWDNFTIIKIGLTGNTAPSAVDDSASTDTSMAVLIDVQSNDSDPEGNPLTTTIVTAPNNGTATVIGTSVEYTPNAGFTGTDTIVYSICDNGAPPLCDNATIIITVIAGTNTAPTAVDDLASTDTSTTVLIDVQVNDSDPQGNPLITAIVSGPNNGTATVIGTLVEYTPNAGFSGMDTIVYSVCDNGTPPLCDNATIIITVVAGNVSVRFEEMYASDISIFPNPFTGEVTLEYRLFKRQDVSLEIYDLSGKLVHTVVDVNQTTGVYKYTVHAEQAGLVAGSYLLQFKTEGTSNVQKIIKL